MVKLRALMERFRSSLFFMPAIYVVVAVGLAELMLRLDSRIATQDLPAYLRSTVDSARAVLSTIAGAIITVAAVVFSVTVVSVQLASSQFSPRILRGFLRDRRQQTVLGFVMGTFTYCLVVLRAVRTREEEAVGEIIPNLSVAVGVGLAVLAAIAILAFIDHSARSMQIGELIHRIAEEAIGHIRRLPLTGEADDPEPPDERGEGMPILARHSGWLQQIDPEGLLSVVQPGSTVRLAARPGDFLSEGTPLCFVDPPPSDPEEVGEEMDEHVQYGRGRTMQQDLEFGLRQVVDVALRALSPGVHDPTTAYEVIVHLEAMLVELLKRDLPPLVVRGEGDRILLRPHELSHGELVARAFDQIRTIGARHPSVALMLLRALGTLRSEVERAGLESRLAPIHDQAQLVLASCRAAEPLAEDLRRVEESARAEGFEV